MNKLAKNVVIVLGCSILAKILSYVWEATLAAKLGVSAQSDALYMTIGVFNVLYPILDLGIWKVFLPIYKTRMVKENTEVADSFANKAESFFLIASAILVVTIIAFATPITWIIAPGFSPELKGLTAMYLRYSSPMYLLMASASVVGAVLQCHDRFIGSQIRELATHVSKIVVFILCYHYLGIYAAIIAFILGSIFRLIIQLPFVNWNWKYKFEINLKDPSLRQMLVGLPSVALTAGIEQINALVDKMLASGLVEGAVSFLNYGNKLMSVFSGMISTAIATALYPTMVQYIAENEREKLNKIVTKSLLAISFLVIPISLFCLVFPKDIVTAAFQRGAFDTNAAITTSSVFQGYAIGMLFVGLTTYITNIFYAFGDTKLTLRISALNIAINVGLNILFSRLFDVTGLAIATSVSTIICFVIRCGFLRRYVTVDVKYLIAEILKILISSAIACFSSWFIFSFVSVGNVILKVVLIGIIIGVVYLGICMVLKLDTLKQVFNLVSQRIHKEKS